jgi:hypothetical protein
VNRARETQLAVVSERRFFAWLAGSIVSSCVRRFRAHVLPPLII